MITLKRTYYRTIAVLALFLVLTLDYRSSLQAYSNFSIFNIISNEKVQQMLTLEVLKDLACFVLFFIIIHIIWAKVITISCQCFFDVIKHDSIKTLIWLNIILLHFILVLSINAYTTPTSLLGFFRTTFLASPIFFLPLSLLLLIIFFFNLYKFHSKSTQIIFAFGMLFSLTQPIFTISKQEVSAKQKPNIIIIGLDGLRPDHLQHREHKINLAPKLNEALEKSILFDKAYTVLPRTYVSWLSLLKSQYPKTHGGRFNLSPENLVDKEIPFLEELKRMNYNTIYALDERRFNHIDTHYGFDKVIGPKTGIADELITNIADFPIINILTNTRLGYYFLPYLYLNRGNGRTFSPEKFNDATLEQLNPNQANFLAIHFCLLHWPYTSKNFIDVDETLWNGNHNHFMYKSLIKQLDEQFNQLMTNLRIMGYLDNALVFFISDHGDSFNLKSDNKIKPIGIEIKTTSWGHGTNVLDQSQSEILLAFSRFKNGKSTTKNVIKNGIFSNLDIIPTLAKELNIHLKNLEGTSLPLTEKDSSSAQHIFVESSKPSKTLDTSIIDKANIFYSAISHYTVNEKGNLVLTEEAYQEFIPLMHRSVYYKNWQLAFIPEMNDFVIVDLEANSLTPLTQVPEIDEIDSLKVTFCSHYKTEMDKHFNEHCN